MQLLIDVKAALYEFVRLDAARRVTLLCDGQEAHLFQPLANYRTLVFNKPLSARMIRNNVARWADYGGIGHLTPHDLRRTAITHALNQGLGYRQIQTMSGHEDPKTMMRYEKGRGNLDLNAVNFLSYETKKSGGQSCVHAISRT